MVDEILEVRMLSAAVEELIQLPKAQLLQSTTSATFKKSTEDKKTDGMSAAVKKIVQVLLYP